MRNLKFWRLECSLSQIELAHATGIPRYRIQLAELGAISLEPIEVELLNAIFSRMRPEVVNGL